MVCVLCEESQAVTKAFREEGIETSRCVHCPLSKKERESCMVCVLCEESQAVTKAFREEGIEAFSCDLKPCSGGHPEWHYVGSALDFGAGCGSFQLEDGSVLEVDKWDIAICHPPCTFLSNAGAVSFYNRDGSRNIDRFRKMELGKNFFLAMFEVNAERICVENPVPFGLADLPPYTQMVHPYMFGHTWQKKTCLWLRGLPPLFATELCIPGQSWCYASKDKQNVTGDRATRRSKTFPGIASAMAAQWKRYCF